LTRAALIASALIEPDGENGGARRTHTYSLDAEFNGLVATDLLGTRATGSSSAYYALARAKGATSTTTNAT